MTTLAAPPAVLIADDDEISRLFLVETLQQAGFRTVACADGAAALQAAFANSFSLALLDVDMPHLNGYDLCRAMRAAPELKHLPIVMITGHDDAASIALAYDAGATDFIAKPVNWTLLPHRIQYILRNADADRQLRHLAYHDSLTSLPNALALFGLACDYCAQAEEMGESVAILQIGVDACTRVRSMFGPELGDEALQAFANKLIGCVGEASRSGARASVARVDGDRFVVCMRGRHADELALQLSEQLAAVFNEPLKCGDQHFFLPPTMGIALYPDHGRDAKSVITHAATARHQAQITEAVEAVMYCDELGADARERLALGAALRRAVRAEQLTLYFQPKIRISDGSFAGVEALLRWFDADLGEISPARFVPLAEESGLILDIGQWVVQAACRQLMNWRNAGFETTMAINFSAKQFAHDDPAELIRAATAASGIDASSLVVEITESALISDPAAVQAGLLAVKALGCRIAIDDFGTGYSSLAYLKDLPVDELKIDRSFVRNLDTKSVDAAICVAVLSLARDVGLKVTAEGVETDLQLDWLKAHHCDEAQGFLFARPEPAHKIFDRYSQGPEIKQGGARVA